MELYNQRAGETEEETLQRAMRDPEVAVSQNKSVLSFYANVAASSQSCLILLCNKWVFLHSLVDQFLIRGLQILQQAQTEPGALQDHMKNPIIRSKIQKLVAAGIIKTR